MIHIIMSNHGLESAKNFVNHKDVVIFMYPTNNHDKFQNICEVIPFDSKKIDETILDAISKDDESFTTWY